MRTLDFQVGILICLMFCAIFLKIQQIIKLNRLAKNSYPEQGESSTYYRPRKNYFIIDRNAFIFRVLLENWTPGRSGL